MIIGVTGLNVSGKGEFCRYLAEKGFMTYSLSDIIREELRKDGVEITRETMFAKGNDLRKRHGSTVLADWTLKKLEPGNDYAIDSIRNPEEVKALKKRKDFRLVYITAPPIEMRFERAKKRMREGETISFEKFRAEEEKELKGNDAGSQQLLACEAMADYKIRNDSALDDFKKRIDELIAKLKRDGL
jgi:dephospho-CoA kinase